MACTPLALTWALTTISGYGIYGLQIALQFLRRGGTQFIATHQSGPILLPSLTLKRLETTLKLNQKIADVMKTKPSELLAFRHPVLYAIGNDCGGFAGQDRVQGAPMIGCAAIEYPRFSDHAKDYIKNYDMVIAISRWNEQFLRSVATNPVHLRHQGIDTTLFNPGPATGLWSDRFIVFSGGKFEFRKGQDIVVEAFKRFHTRHPDALLLTCWQNYATLDPTPFQMAGHCKTIPAVDKNKGLQAAAWLLEQGLPAGSFLELPFTSNMLMPSVLRECHAAVFPNRCEGGTNLVAMECMACGIPTVVSNNTGQKDLVDLLDFPAFQNQKKVCVPDEHPCTDDWGETDPDEVVEALEKIYTQHQGARAQALICAEKLKAWDWGLQNEKLLSLFCDSADQ